MEHPAALPDVQQLEGVPEDGPQVKLCKGCDTFKALADFNRRKASKDGHQNRCRECQHPEAMARRAETEAMLARGLKWCGKCQKVKVVSDFSRSASKSSGFESHCKACKKAASMTYRYDVCVERKHCPNCENEKAASEFYPDPSKKTGLSSWCQSCTRQHIVRWNADHPEARKGTVRRYYRRHRETILARTDNEAAVRRVVRWARENPDKAKAHRQAWRARKQNARGAYTGEQWRALLDFYGHACLRCGAPGATADHVVPLCRGGSNDIENIQPLCHSCNSSKGVKDTDYRDPERHTEFMVGLLVTV